MAGSLLPYDNYLPATALERCADTSCDFSADCVTSLVYDEAVMRGLHYHNQLPVVVLSVRIVAAKLAGALSSHYCSAPRKQRSKAHFWHCFCIEVCVVNCQDASAGKP